MDDADSPAVKTPASGGLKRSRKTYLFTPFLASKFSWATSHSGGLMVKCGPCSAIRGYEVSMKANGDTLHKHEFGQVKKADNSSDHASDDPTSEDDLSIPASAPATNHQRNVVLLELQKQAAAAIATPSTTQHIMEAMGNMNTAAFQGKLPQLMMVLHALQYGRPMTSYEQAESLLVQSVQ
eukprot:gene5502-5542_t